MRRLLITSAVLAMGAAAALPALAQPGADAPPPGMSASQPVPDTSQQSSGIPGDQAVNPAPDAQGPYVGVGKQGFYDVDARIADVSGKAAALPAAQKRKAMAVLKQVKAEEAIQRARHNGQLRDWDRENINDKLDHLVQSYPALGAEG